MSGLIDAGPAVQFTSRRSDIIWLIWASLAVATVVAFGRLAFTVFVPAMKEALGYSTLQIGWIGTANLLGYTLGTLSAGPAARVLGRKRTIVIALILTVLSLGMMAVAGSLPPHLALRCLAGVASGWGSVMISTLVLDRSPAGRAGVYFGISNCGAGLGIALSGLLLPSLLVLDEGWRLGWLAVAALSIVITAGFSLCVDDRPARSSRPDGSPQPQEGGLSRLLRNRVIVATFICYALFGAGYTAVATFFVPFLQDDQQLGPQVANSAWTVVGTCAAVGPFLFGILRDVVGSHRAVIVAHIAVGMAIALLVGVATPASAMLGSILFGTILIGLGTVVIVYVKEAADPRATSSVVAAAIVSVSIGQAVGPAAAGLLAEATGSMAVAFWVAALACALGAPVALLVRRPGFRVSMGDH